MSARMRFDPATGRPRSEALQAVIRARVRAEVKNQQPRRVRVATERADFCAASFADSTVEADVKADDMESAEKYELRPEEE